MVAQVITTGELQKLYWIAESVYGTTPTSALTWGGDTIEAKDTTDAKREFRYQSNNRAFGSSLRGMMMSGFDWKGTVRPSTGGYSWVNFFAVNALGAAAAVTDRLPSFSSIVWIKQTIAGVTSYQYFLYNGCKMNKLEINAPGVGQALEFTASIVSRWGTPATSKVFTGLQNVTVGADPADPVAASTPVPWYAQCMFNLNNGGWTQGLRPRSWKLSIDNHIEATPGMVAGADATIYNVANELVEGQREITLDMVLPAKDQTFQTAKRLGQTIGMKVYVDDRYVVLTGGYFTENDFPSYTVEKPNDETLKMKFNAITI